jgi:hypothetical protein
MTRSYQTMVEQEKEEDKKIKPTLFSAGDWIALAALAVMMLFNIFGLLQTQKSLDILVNKEAVNLKPVLGIDALMYKNSQLGTPKISIFNNGKVPAINVVVQIIRRQFDGKSFTGAVWGNGDGAQYVFDEIKTYETKQIKLPDNYVEDPEYNVMEVRIYYMREYDKQSFSFRTFFFYGPAGWNFESWYNIKQAKLLDGNPFATLIDMSLKLHADLNGDLKNMIGTELHSFDFN